MSLPFWFSECGVTANIPVLGTGDSGFESRHSDTYFVFRGLYMSKKFQKKLEDFTCEQCATLIKGNGFTNHCTQCLWSKHVDNNPGDRESLCGGLMEPVGVEKAKEDFKIVHRCQVCGLEKRNSVTLDDNFDNLAALAKKIAEKTMKEAGK